MGRFRQKVKKNLKRTASDNAQLRPYVRGFINGYERCQYWWETRKLTTDPRMVVFCSFQGQSYSDNPKALFEYMMRSGRFEGYTFVWAFKKDLPSRRKQMKRLKNRIANERLAAELGIADLSLLWDTGDAPETLEELEEFPENAEARIEELFEEADDPVTEGGAAVSDHGESASLTEDSRPLSELDRRKERRAQIRKTLPRIVIVKYLGRTWRKYVGTAKYWFFNFKIDDSLFPRADQVFLQTWHGTPLKRLGYDLEHFDNLMNTEAEMKKRYGVEVRKFTYFLSPSAFATEKFKSAWRMEDFGKGDIIVEEGYPRNDILFNYTEENLDRIKNRIFGYFYLPYEKQIKRKTIVLYAPTYRANQHKTGVGYTYKTEVDFDRLQRELRDDFIILFRAHYFVASKFDFRRYGGFIYDVSKVNDINDLYLIADVLVTDYSSSMFDYANLRRPMIFHMYDLEHYRDESNGFYFDPGEELPGPIVRTDDELIAALRAVPEFTYDEKYRRFNEKFDPLDDGHVCERVVNRVFGSEDERRGTEAE